jgi:hypothetical protein
MPDESNFAGRRERVGLSGFAGSESRHVLPIDGNCPNTGRRSLTPEPSQSSPRKHGGAIAGTP